jgi:hypothetical protein
MYLVWPTGASLPILGDLEAITLAQFAQINIKISI